MVKGDRVTGFTLLELIVFIVVAGIFIPLAYVAFMAVARGSMTPENVMTARFLAEGKLEDITKDTYLNLQGEQASYSAVPGYAGYQWRWTIQLAAYRGRTTHVNPTVGLPEQWMASTPTHPVDYRVGDHVIPVNTACPTTHFYRCVPVTRWQSLTVHAVETYVSPTQPNNYSYRCTTRSISPSTFSQWEPGHPYTVGSFIVPTAWNGHAYVCTTAGTSGPTEPSSWPTNPQAILNEGFVAWREATLTTNVVEPSWGSADQVDDGTITWMRETMHSGATEPTWPCTLGMEIDDGTLRWKESTAYKHITVCVGSPRATSTWPTQLSPQDREHIHKMNRGFTLIELVVVIVISSIVSVFTFSFIYHSIRTYNLLRTQRQLYEDGAYALERITRDLRDASFNVSAGAGISFMKPSWSALQAPNVVDRNPFVRYYRSGTDLYRCSDTTSDSVCLSNPSVSPTNKLLASNIGTFTVQLNDQGTACPSSNLPACQDDSFTITIGLAKDSQSLTLSTTVTPKNYCTGGTSAGSCSSNDYANRSFNGDYSDVVN